MCKALKICRSTYYYEVNVVRKAEKEAQEHILTESIISIFKIEILRTSIIELKLYLKNKRAERKVTIMNRKDHFLIYYLRIFNLLNVRFLFK